MVFDTLAAEARARYEGKTYYEQLAMNLQWSTVSHPMCLELRSLQGISILHYQKRLLQEYQQIVDQTNTSGEQMLRVQTLLADYSRALHDFETMTQRATVPSNEPLQIHSILFPELAEMNAKRSYPLSLRKLAKGQHSLSKLKETAERAVREEQQRREWIWEARVRFIMAILGGLMLIVPMLIMTLVRGQTTALVTVSVAVLLFSILIATLSKAKPQEVLGATAAYAAVLIVFVGSTSVN